MKKESRLQQDCFVWFHNNYPLLRGLLCYNLNNSKNRIDGAINKSLGLQAGRSDMVFYYKGKTTMIEFKTEIGKQIDVQKQWQHLIEEHGFEYYLIRDIETFKKLIICKL